MRNPFKKETNDLLEQRVMAEVFALLKRNRVAMSVTLKPLNVMGEQLFRPMIVFTKIPPQEQKQEQKVKENGHK